MLFADAPPTETVTVSVTPAAPASFRERVKGYATRAGQTATTYASKAERIIDAPVYDAAAVLGVDVIWLGGIVFTLKILTMGLAMEFRRPVCCPSCPVASP